MINSTLTIAGNYQNLAAIGQFVTHWAIESGLNERAVYAVQMAVDEACSNIIEHAYGGEGKGDIELHCRKLDDGLEVTVRDKGRPFDPTLVDAPNIHAPLEERNEGGLGLFLMKELMDDVAFEFGKNGNTLLLVKRK